MFQRLLTTSALLACLALLPACGNAPSGGDGHDHDHDHAEHAHPFDGVTKAICVLTPTNNADLSGVSGIVTFTQTHDGVRIEATVTGLTPNSKHGFHIHQFGDVSVADGTGTGGHYDPAGSEHGLPTSHSHGDHEHHAPGGHAGDLGNLEADADGKATYSKTFEGITVAGLQNPILGRSIIVHLKEDDGGQPTGNAGPRVAQGVIGVAKTE